MIGGKFLERCRLKKPDSNEYYCEADLYTGSVVTVNKFVFRLFQADEYTLSQVQSRRDLGDQHI